MDKTLILLKAISDKNRLKIYSSLAPLFKWINRKIENSTQVTQDLEALEKILCIPCEDLSQKQRNRGNCAKIIKTKER